MCALEHGGLDTCDGGSNGIPWPAPPAMFQPWCGKGRGVADRARTLNGLSVVITPGRDNANGVTGWTRNCNLQSDSALHQACEDVFHFDDADLERQ
ncbi:hypothetical protein ACLK1U_00625 [Escherichia coli]